MDGTLLRKDKTVSERTKKAIEDARKKIDEQKIYNEVRFGVNSF